MVISLALSYSCTEPENFKVEPDPVIPEKSTTLVLTATLEQQNPADTKIALVKNNGQNTYDVSWIEGGTISVLGYSGGNDEFSLKDGADTNKGKFQGNLTAGSIAPYCAVFPYRSTNAFDSEGLKISIPQTINAEIGKVNPVAAPMVGSVILPEDEAGEAKIRFDHLFGILKISVRSDKKTQIKKVVIHDMGGNMLWGTCCVPVDPKARGFYKSIFIDAGMYLSNYFTKTYLDFIGSLGLDVNDDYEFFSTVSATNLANTDEATLEYYQNVQRGIFAGTPFGSGLNWDDYNGVLQYPDGSPRFRSIYVYGGKSKEHGPTLGDVGRARVKEYFENGGGYTASCAGAFMACEKVDGAKADYTFGIIPVDFRHTHSCPSACPSIPRYSREWPFPRPCRTWLSNMVTKWTASSMTSGIMAAVTRATSLPVMRIISRTSCPSDTARLRMKAILNRTATSLPTATRSGSRKRMAPSKRETSLLSGWRIPRSPSRTEPSPHLTGMPSIVRAKKDARPRSMAVPSLPEQLPTTMPGASKRRP